MHFIFLLVLVSVFVVTPANESLNRQRRALVTTCDVCKKLVKSGNDWAAIEVAARMDAKIDAACAETKKEAAKCRTSMHNAVKSLRSQMLNAVSPAAACIKSRQCPP